MSLDTSARIRGRALQSRRLSVWRTNPRCVKCHRLTRYPDGFELDHIIPLFKGGKDTQESCQLLCKGCHSIKTAQDMGHRIRQAIGIDGWPL
jgi:5-methylcytosine-specific restriction protein A